LPEVPPVKPAPRERFPKLGEGPELSEKISAAMPLTRSHPSAASIALRAATLYERAGAEQDQTVLAECIALYHRDVHMTSSLNGITVRTHGRDELRRVIVEAMSDNRRYRHLNTEVVVDEGERALLRTTLLVLQGDRPLVAVPVQWRIRLRDGLISESHGAESPPEDQPNWAPLGSTYSLGGEILGPWGDGQLLARLYDGRPLELPAPEELDDEWEVGAQLMVFFVNEAVVGWYLPDKQLGVDFSNLGATA
jgi:SnoaL-like protein